MRKRAADSSRDETGGESRRDEMGGKKQTERNDSMSFFIPEGYAPAIDLRETQKAIKTVKDFFQKEPDKAVKFDQGFGAAFCDAGVGLE